MTNDEWFDALQKGIRMIEQCSTFSTGWKTEAIIKKYFNNLEKLSPLEPLEVVTIFRQALLPYNMYMSHDGTLKHATRYYGEEPHHGLKMDKAFSGSSRAQSDVQ